MIYRLPPINQTVDQQFVQVYGPDGIISGFQVDKETKSYYIKESQVIIPSFHGITHIAEDPVPIATVDTQGHMSADDKAKLEALLQMRVGVLGFQGAGFPDDGGWMQGDIILSAGSENISIERIGNVVRFTVDTPIPLNCNCETCAQIYWIQDETDVASIRPPSCAGVLPGVNMYGEMKVFLFPESTIVDPTDTADILKHKDDYPALIFRRYEDSTSPSLGSLEMILRRASSGTTLVGHSMTPGDPAQGEQAEVVWFTGQDADGNLIRFDFQSEQEPGLFGALLYKGHTLTRKMGVIVDYTPTVLSTNQYVIRYWDIQSEEPNGDSFTATNIWRYNNPENSFTDASAPKSLQLDGYGQVLQVGTLVQLWEMKVNDSVTRRYFNLEPHLTASVIWSMAGAARFGDTLTERDETGEDIPEVAVESSSDKRLFEKSEWGLTWFDDPLHILDPSGSLIGPINNRFVADVDYNLPGLRVNDNTVDTGDEYILERPVFMWQRRNHRNFYAKMLVGQPDSSDFPPIDILLRAPIDSYCDRFMTVTGSGVFSEGGSFSTAADDLYYILVAGAQWHDLPETGHIFVMRGATTETMTTWKYTNKAMATDGTVLLIGETQFPVENPTVVDPIVVALLHADYNAPCLRLEFSVNTEQEIVELQFRSGVLDMNTPYELDNPSPEDDLVKGFEELNYAVSRWYTQNGFIRHEENPSSDPANFRCYMGGFLTAPIGDVTERWNTLELMVRDDQLWIWWNGLLIPPDLNLSPTPLNTPYFPISNEVEVGKFGMRLWPGTKLRQVEVYSQNQLVNEFIHGQLEITA